MNISRTLKRLKNEIKRARKGILYGAVLGGGYAFYVFGQKTTEIMSVVAQNGRSGLLDSAFTTLSSPEMAMFKFVFLRAIIGAYIGFVVEKLR